MSCVYVISEGKLGPVKVGVSKNPLARLIELQCGNPKKLNLIDWWELPTRGDAFRIEGAIHDEMKPYALVGEWINADEFGMCALVQARIEEAFHP